VSELQPVPRPRSPSDQGGGGSPASTVENVWRCHGQALFALALVVCEDAETAESVVVRAILDACTPAELAVGAVGRQELARYVYVLWQRRGAEAVSAGTRTCADPEVPASTGAGLSSRQRSAIALALFGDHTYREAASLMGLAPPDVAELMRSGLIAAARGHR
jgi:hypothetical protein